MEHDLYDPLRRYPRNRLLSMISGSASFPLLELVLDPTKSPPPLLRDAVLASIDLECRDVEPLGKRQITQVGVASLDTRILAEIDTDSSESLVGAIQSRLFSVYPKRASPKAWCPTPLWTTPEKIGHDEMRDKLNEIFFDLGNSSTARCDGDLGPPAFDLHETSRNVVLVGYSIQHDRSLLMELLDVDIKRIASIRVILDTGRMMCSAYDFGLATHAHFNLNRMLLCLDICRDQMHDASNDAMFTMKAPILMFSNWKHQKHRCLWNSAEDVTFKLESTDVSENLLWECQLEVLTAIARASWPTRKKSTSSRKSTILGRHTNAESDLLLAEDLNLMHTFS